MLCKYVLRNGKEVRLYKGLTNNLDKQLEEHNSGQNIYTKGFYHDNWFIGRIFFIEPMRELGKCP